MKLFHEKEIINNVMWIYKLLACRHVMLFSLFSIQNSSCKCISGIDIIFFSLIFVLNNTIGRNLIKVSEISLGNYLQTFQLSVFMYGLLDLVSERWSKFNYKCHLWDTHIRLFHHSLTFHLFYCNPISKSAPKLPQKIYIKISWNLTQLPGVMK